jgi:hypothetical protein
MYCFTTSERPSGTLCASITDHQRDLGVQRRRSTKNPPGTQRLCSQYHYDSASSTRQCAHYRLRGSSASLCYLDYLMFAMTRSLFSRNFLNLCHLPAIFSFNDNYANMYVYSIPIFFSIPLFYITGDIVGRVVAVVGESASDRSGDA